MAAPACDRPDELGQLSCGNVHGAGSAKRGAQLPREHDPVFGVLDERVDEHRARSALEREDVPVGSRTMIERRSKLLEPDGPAEKPLEQGDPLGSHASAIAHPRLTLRDGRRVCRPLLAQHPPRHGLQVGARTRRHEVHDAR